MSDLVKKAMQGDKQAFTQLILSIKTDLYRIAKARLKDDEDVYDAIQETMIIAFKSIKKLKNTDSFKPWIIKILINTSKYYYKKSNKTDCISLEKIEAYSSVSDSNFDKVETILDFNFILNNFKYEDRMIIILYYVEKFTDKEIGKILNLKENTVKTKRKKKKKKIKGMIKGGQEIYG